MSRANLIEVAPKSPSNTPYSGIRLFILRGPAQRESFIIEKSKASLGRSPDNDIQINSESVSNKQAIIFNEGGKYFLENLAAANNIHISNNPVYHGQKVEVEKGLPIQIGDVVFTLGRKCSEDSLPARGFDDPSGTTNQSAKFDSSDRRESINRKVIDLIYDLSLSLLNTLDLRLLGRKILSCMFSYLAKVDSVHVVVEQSRGGGITEIASRAKAGVKKLEINNLTILAKRVMAEGKPLSFMENISQDKTNSTEPMITPQIRSVLCVPLMSKISTRGAIIVQSLSLGHKFRKEDISFTVGLSVPATLAIENALLFTKRKQAEEALKKARDGLEIAVRRRTDELVRAKAEVEKLSIIDEMSGLYNYRHFVQTLEKEYARAVRYNHAMGLMMIDIDHFKMINDTYGHPCGDVVIKRLAILIKQYVRETDIVARYGGDEMVVVLPETSRDSALEVAAKVKKAAEHFNFDWLGKVFSVSISLGLATAPDPAFKDSSDLVCAADRALYQAKKNGRNCICAL